MVQDFTKLDSKPAAAEPSDPLTEAVRAGIRSQSGLAGVALGIQKLTGELPLGIDAPSKGLRKWIGGSGELLAALKHGFGALIFLPLGLASCYVGISERDLYVLGFGVISLALGALLAKWALQAARNLRSIAKA